MLIYPLYLQSKEFGVLVHKLQDRNLDAAAKEEVITVVHRKIFFIGLRAVCSIFVNMFNFFTLRNSEKISGSTCQMMDIIKRETRVYNVTPSNSPWGMNIVNF